MAVDAALLGLTAAAAFGCADTMAAVITRRIGSRATTGIVVPLTAILLVAVYLVVGGSPLHSLASLAGSLVLGANGSALYFLGYAAFRAGPVSIVAPILSASGGLTVLLSIAFLGERPSALSLGCAVLATVGIVLASVVLTGARRGRLSGPGIRYALVTLVLAGSAPILATLVIRDEHWLTTLTFARITNAALVLTVLVAIRFFRVGGPASVDGPAASRVIAGMTRPTAITLVVLATLEVAAICAAFAGIAIGPTWLVGLTSSFGPLVVVAGGLILFRERPARVQWAGVAMVLASAVVLAARP